MEIFDYAMGMEEESASFYRALGESCGNETLQAVFELLTEQELAHYNTLKALRDGSDVAHQTSDLLADAKAIFSQLRDAEGWSCALDQTELYRQAQGIEEKARAHYLERAESASGDGERDLFSRLAEEERKHWALLDNIVELTSRPEQWIEDAEWTHLDQY